MMKKKVMPLSCLMAVAMLAGCGTAAPAVPEETTAPAAEIAEAVQETAPANDAESEAAAVEETAGVWQVEPCYNFDEIVPLYSEWDHTAGKNAADGLYAVRDGERWSLFSAKTGNIMMQDAAQQMADYAKDSEKQAALRRQIEKHPIWQYPPEERLQHNREWQSLYLLVFEFKEFLQKLENRLNNAEYDTGLLKQDEDAMLDARYTRRSKLRNKLDTLTFTEAMRKAVARYDASSGKGVYGLF